MVTNSNLARVKSFIEQQAENSDSDLYEFLLFIRSIWGARKFLLVGGSNLRASCGIYSSYRNDSSAKFVSTIPVEFNLQPGNLQLDRWTLTANYFLAEFGVAKETFREFYRSASFSKNYTEQQLNNLIAGDVAAQSSVCSLNPRPIVFKFERDSVVLQFIHAPKLSANDIALLVRIFNTNIAALKVNYANRDGVEERNRQLSLQSANEETKLVCPDQAWNKCFGAGCRLASTI